MASGSSLAKSSGGKVVISGGPGGSGLGSRTDVRLLSGVGAVVGVVATGVAVGVALMSRGVRSRCSTSQWLI